MKGQRRTKITGQEGVDFPFFTHGRKFVFQSRDQIGQRNIFCSRRIPSIESAVFIDKKMLKGFGHTLDVEMGWPVALNMRGHSLPPAMQTRIISRTDSCCRCIQVIEFRRQWREIWRSLLIAFTLQRRSSLLF